MKKMYAVYGNSKEDGLCGCSVFPTREDAAGYVRNMFSDMARDAGYAPEDADDETALETAAKAGEYEEDEKDGTLHLGGYLTWSIEPVFIRKKDFEEAKDMEEPGINKSKKEAGEN